MDRRPAMPSPFDLSFSHPRSHQCILRSNPEVTRGLQRPANVGVFGSRIECNQPHAVWALHLIAGLETRGSFGKGFAAIRAKAFNSIGHESLLTDDALWHFTISLTCMMPARYSSGPAPIGAACSDGND
jgi:hypothetical protein